MVIAVVAVLMALTVFALARFWGSGNDILQGATLGSLFAGVILGVAAVTVGFVALGRVKRGEANNKRVAIAGITLGFVAVIVSMAIVLFATVLILRIISALVKTATEGG